MNLNLKFVVRLLSPLIRGIRGLTACLFILSLSMATSCKKSSPGSASNSPYYIKFKLNGVQKNYSTVAAASTKGSGYYLLVMDGATATNANNGEALIIELASPTTFAANTTFMPAFINGGAAVIGALLTYSDNTQSAGYTSSYPNLTTNPKASVTITDLSTTTIKGTFTATLVSGADYTTVKYQVTDGEFYMKLTSQ